MSRYNGSNPHHDHHDHRKDDEDVEDDLFDLDDDPIHTHKASSAAGGDNDREEYDRIDQKHYPILQKPTSSYHPHPHNPPPPLPIHNHLTADHPSPLSSSSSSSSRTKLQTHGFWDVLSFGICVSASNCFIDWASGFEHGYWDYLFTTFVTSLTFFCLHLCIAEMVSMLPFAGGMYGFARVTCTPYVGFLVGCFESVANIVYTLIAMMPIGSSITLITGWDSKYEPIYWFLAYFLVIVIEFSGRNTFYSFLRCIAFLNLSLLTLYFILSAQDIHPLEYLPMGNHMKENLFQNGMKDMMPLLPVSGWYYFGVEIMPLVSDEIREAKVNVPRAIAGTLLICTVTAYICMFVAFTQYPSFGDDYQMQNLPLNAGYMNALGISNVDATILSLPALYISNALLIFGYGKQLRALSKSKLVPSFFGWTLPNSSVPYMALLIGSLTGYIILLILVLGMGMNYNSFFINTFYYSAMMGTYTTFFIMFFSYLIFYYRYSNLKRAFRNPFGPLSAIIGIIGLGIMSGGLIAFMGDNFESIQQFLGFVGVVSLYYYVYARHYQIFSDDEQSIMFIIYLMKANQQRHHKIHHSVRRKSNRLSPIVSFPFSPRVPSAVGGSEVQGRRVDEQSSTNNSVRSIVASLRAVVTPSLSPRNAVSGTWHQSRQKFHRICVTSKEEKEKEDYKLTMESTALPDSIP